MPDLIQARVLKGFRDYLPDAELDRAGLVEALVAVFKAHGFVPIDTPALEYAEILLGKAGGETEKQVYRFKDNGDRDVALRFDLTVPFARFMAEHVGELYLPFRRYHIAKVWRGENTQRGRYREFMQCDFDIVGVDSASADFDIVATIAASMKALGVPGFKININHRGLFNRFLARVGASEASVDVLRTVDKLAKQGKDETGRQLTALLGRAAAEETLEFIKDGEGFSPTLDRLSRLAGGPNPDGDRLSAIAEMAEACGLSESIRLAPSITRGLDYYTGVVFETFVDGIADIGSVCSGGRYNDLASLYTAKRLPGVGSSVGLDRLLSALEALGSRQRPGGLTRVLVSNLDDARASEYQAAAAAFRSAGLACEVYPEAKKIGPQYSYAEAKGASVMASAGPAGSGAWTLRDLSARANEDFPDLASAVKAAVGKLA